MGESATKRIARAETANKFDLAWGNANSFFSGCQHHAVSSKFDDCKRNAVTKKFVGDLVRVSQPDRHFAFGAIADYNRAVCNCCSCSHASIVHR